MPVRSRSRFSISSRNAPQSFWIARSSSSSASQPSRITPPSRITAAGSSCSVRASRACSVRRRGAAPAAASSSAGWPLAGERRVQLRAASRACRAGPARSRGRALRSATRVVMRSTSDHAEKSSAAAAGGAGARRGAAAPSIAAWRRAQHRCVAQRVVQPVAQAPAAHRGRAAVEQREERGRFGPGQRLGDLEVAARGRVHQHELALALDRAGRSRAAAPIAASGGNRPAARRRRAIAASMSVAAVTGEVGGAELLRELARRALAHRTARRSRRFTAAAPRSAHLGFVREQHLRRLQALELGAEALARAPR